MNKFISLLILTYCLTGCGLVELWDTPFTSEEMYYDVPKPLPALKVPPALLNSASVKQPSSNAATQ